MTNMEQPHILYDSQIFDLQKFGGISRYFCEIISKLGMAYDISVRFTENHYLAQAKLARHRIHAPHFFFKHYKQVTSNVISLSFSPDLLQSFFPRAYW